MPSVALRGETDVMRNISLPEEPLSWGDHFRNRPRIHFPESAVSCQQFVLLALNENFLYNMTFDIRQPSLNSVVFVCQLLMIESQQMKNRCV